MNAELRWRYQSIITLFGIGCLIIIGRTLWLQLSPVSPQLRDVNAVYEGAWVAQDLDPLPGRQLALLVLRSNPLLST